MLKSSVIIFYKGNTTRPEAHKLALKVVKREQLAQGCYAKQIGFYGIEPRFPWITNPSLFRPLGQRASFNSFHN